MKKRITRCLALLLAVVMVLSVMPVAMAEETTQTQTYTKVTEAPADWSGTYLIVSEGDKLIMDGSLDKLDVEGNKVDVTITDSKITGDYAKYAFTVEPMTGGYAIKSASGKYISGKSGSNKLNSGSTQSLNTIELTSGKVIVTSDGTTLQYNNAAKNGTRFRYYKSQNQQPISLYKIETAAKQQVETPTATPAAGEVAKGTKVEFKCKTEGAKISYKTTGEYTEYTDPVEVNADTTFTVKATKDGMDDSDEVKFAYTVKAEEPVQSLFKDGEQIVIYNPANMKALSTEYSGFYNKGTDVTLTNGTLTGYTEADVWTVGVNADGSYTFSTKDGKKLSMGEKFTQHTAGRREHRMEGFRGCERPKAAIYIQNAARGNYLEWYAEKNNWSSYSRIGDEALFAQQFYLVVDDGGSDEPSGDLPKPGDKFVIYNQNAQAVLAAENDSKSIEKAAATVADGKATPANGAVVFTVEQNGEYLRFKSDAYGYLCANGTGNNAFYSKDFSEEGVSTEDADWLVRTCSGGVGGYELESRTAKFSGHSQWLEYFSDSFKVYSMYSKTGDLDYTIYSFFFYPVAEGVNVDGGLVVQPTITFPETMLPAYVGSDYEFELEIDTIYEIDNPWIEYSVKKADGTYIPGISQLQGNTDVEVPGDFTTGKGSVHITVYDSDIAEAAKAGSTMTLTFAFKDVKGNEARASYTVDILDEAVISNVKPAQGAQTGAEKRPEISAEISNAGENASVTMTVNGAEVKTTYADGKVTYTPAADMADGKVTVTVTVKRADEKETSKTWSFTIGEATFQRYFGQLHSHTQYSDGAGSLESALAYIKALPDSANVDFVAFTDHSNYFDKSGAANPEGALYDMTKATEYSQETWKAYKDAVAAFNTENAGSMVAIAGFEMTWSGGPGHINTFNTPGIVSRNNTTLNNKTKDAGLQAYYKLLSQTEGVDSISQFNHPGTTFGNFIDFGYWDAVVDTRMYMVEVGNGEGQIGAGGYYPSYEQYIMALDKGWHVAPTNNQDNHKGRWGNANDARDVILTDDFSESGIYAALRARRMYATEDKNLELDYTVNGNMMGSIIDVPEKLNFEISFNDPDRTDSIAKVELVVNSGKVAYTWDSAADLTKGSVSVELAPEYTYYFVRVTEADGDLAVTAPVWVGESLKLGISKAECGTSTPVTDEELTITTTFFNSEAKPATIKSITYAIGGETIGTVTDPITLAASSTQDVEFKYTSDKGPHHDCYRSRL